MDVAPAEHATRRSTAVSLELTDVIHPSSLNRAAYEIAAGVAWRRNAERAALTEVPSQVPR